jgi:threonine aldolase
MINFRSDNNAGVDPHILDALIAEAARADDSYGRDEVTRRLDAVWSSVFETAVRVIPLLSGTAANSISLAAVTPPHGAVLCSAHAHIVQDEVNAPGFFQPGLALKSVESVEGKIPLEAIDSSLKHWPWNSPNCSQASTLSLTQATEWGTVYSLTEVAGLANLAKRYKLKVHLDGARLANAIAHLHCTPAAATWRAGVDILSLGAAKNGCMLAEALVMFGNEDSTPVRYRSKQSGQMAAKLRFVSAQLTAYCRDDLWLKLAVRANDAAQRLAQALVHVPGVRIIAPVEANIVLVALPRGVNDGLQQRGFAFHRWLSDDTARFVTSFDTRDADIDALVAAVKSLAALTTMQKTP